MYYFTSHFWCEWALYSIILFLVFSNINASFAEVDTFGFGVITYLLLLYVWGREICINIRLVSHIVP